jgi:guanine nucleotide-binding protein subunit alpha
MLLATLSSFLNDVERIASRSYEPSDDDVLRARLRTLGVQEYKIEISPENAKENVFSGTSNFLCFSAVSNDESFIGMGGIEYGREWRIYDVGGSRTAVLPCFFSARIALQY